MTRAQDEGCARVSERACWYDNEEGDFRRSIYRGEQSKGARKTARSGATTIKDKASRGTRRNREHRASRPMEVEEVAFVLLIYTHGVHG